MKLSPETRLHQSAALEISNLAEMPANAAASPFAGLGFMPDNYKAYITFDICHALPNVIGPTQEGSYIGYMPETLAASASILNHQQMNIRHMLKAYSPDTVARDRIIGCIVATYFPKAPMGGWKMEATAEAAPCIQACAVVFKLAEGVPALIGKHLASREKQSVSIEAVTTYDNIGLWVPSQPDKVSPLLNPGEFASALGEDKKGNLTVGKMNGEQVVMVYGLNGKSVDLRGVGMTPRPAERIAKIIDVRAEELAEALKGTDFEGGELHAIAAESHDGELVGQKLQFATGRTGVVREVLTKGYAVHGGFKLAASAENPVLDFEMPDKRHVLMRLCDVSARLRE